MPKEGHYINRSNWLRAATLGANDGIISTASLLLGVASAGLNRPEMLIAGLAGLTAGALSMAAGEYVSVSAQADIEAADLDRERVSLRDHPDYELNELAEGLAGRGVDAVLALRVAEQMTAHDALEAHAREELGMLGIAANANPPQAALASALAFALGAFAPLIGALLAPAGMIPAAVFAVAVFGLVGLGGLGAWLGGARLMPAILRILAWGCAAMAVTALVGRYFGVTH